jgi:hypothetical protein
MRRASLAAMARIFSEYHLFGVEGGAFTCLAFVVLFFLSVVVLMTLS